MSRGQIEKNTYLTIIGNKITERLGQTDVRKDEADASVYPECNNVREIFDDEKNFKKTVFERMDGYVDGYIENIEVITGGEYGDKIHITMNDGTEKFILQLKLDSSYGTMFLKIVPNIDFGKVVQFRVGNNGFFGVSQDSELVKFFFTKDTPNGIPQAPEFDQPYEKWDRKQKKTYEMYKLDRAEFLEDFLKDVVLPKLKAVTQNINTSFVEKDADEQKKEANDDVDKEEKPEDDGLPF